MKFETLKRLRVITPGIIGAALTFPSAFYCGLSKDIPWGWVGLGSLAVAVIYAAIYDGLKIRKHFWDVEQRDYVGEQIKSAILDLTPKDITLSLEEIDLIRQRTDGKIGGIFWEKIDSDSVLREQKQFFYDNGYKYSTCFDVLVIGFVLGLLNIAAFPFTSYMPFVFGGFIGVLAAFLAYMFIPRYRRQHLENSREQLTMLRERRGKEISSQLREIVTEYRIIKQKQTN